MEALDTAYQWQELTEADDSFYDAFRQILQAAGVECRRPDGRIAAASIGNVPVEGGHPPPQSM